jgi:hypothetical protein
MPPYSLVRLIQDNNYDLSKTGEEAPYYLDYGLISAAGETLEECAVFAYMKLVEPRIEQMVKASYETHEKAARGWALMQREFGIKAVLAGLRPSDTGPFQRAPGPVLVYTTDYFAFYFHIIALSDADRDKMEDIGRRLGNGEFDTPEESF